jgi:hypothetical protein
VRNLASAFAAVVTFAVTAASWGGLNAPPFSHDEASYLLQARILAGGHWSAPSPPLPEFFEQYHVLVTPVLASKYPPGHSLLLAPGIWLSAEGLVPLVLSALTAALLVALIARRWGTSVALIAWAVWLAAPLGLHFRPTYLSQVTTAFLWVVGWWCLSRWWDGGRDGYLVGLAGVVGWMAITRPLTAVAYAIPLAVVLVPRIWRERRWRAFGSAMVAGSLVAAILPVWSKAVTGGWERTPLGIYTEQYMPWDRMGFGLDSTPPLRAGPPDMGQFAARYVEWHRSFTPVEAARIAGRRARRLKAEVWGGAGLLALVLAVAGIRMVDRPLGMALAQGALLFLLYSLYSHGVVWNVYYLEALPVFCILPVLGLAWLDGRMPGGGPVRSPRLLLAGGCILLALMAEASAAELRRVKARAKPQLRLRAALAAASTPAVVFVRRRAGHSHHVQLAGNSVDMADAPIWLAHDLGERNRELLELAEGRSAYVFDEASGRLTRLGAPRRD